MINTFWYNMRLIFGFSINIFLMVLKFYTTVENKSLFDIKKCSSSTTFRKM